MLPWDVYAADEANGERRCPEHGRANAGMERDMRGILLWLVGIPIPIIILLYFFGYM